MANDNSFKRTKTMLCYKEHPISLRLHERYSRLAIAERLGVSYTYLHTVLRHPRKHLNVIQYECIADMLRLDIAEVLFMFYGGRDRGKQLRTWYELNDSAA